MIPACLWFVKRGKTHRKNEILFIDARKKGQMITKKNRELTDEDIANISSTYHNWKSDSSDYQDIA